MLHLFLWGAAFCVVFYYYFVRPLNYWKQRGVKQSNPSWIFGDIRNTVFQQESITEVILRLYNEQKSERYFGMYQLTKPALLLRDPDLIKQITVKDFEHFMDHQNVLPEDSDPLWNKNLFALKGQKWKEMRPVLSPSFTSSKMKSIFVLMVKSAETFTDHFKNKVNGIEELEMKDTLSIYANDLIASVVFGVEVDSLKDINNQFYLRGKEASNFTTFKRTMTATLYRLLPKFCKFFNIRLFGRQTSKFFTDLVNETVEMREKMSIVRPDMINLLLEARKGIKRQEQITTVDTGFATVEETNFGKALDSQTREITNLDITAQALIFFTAGFESVTSMMSFMAYELAVNPDIQKKLRDEIKHTHEECNGVLTYEALMKMKYMDMVVSESLRKWPSFTLATRLCTKPYTIEPVKPEESPVYLKRGDVVLLPIQALQRDPLYYPKPNNFNPERFNDDNQQKINPYTFLSFGVGPRNCIGSRFALIECKTLFYHLLLNLELVPVKRTNIPLRLSKKTFTVQTESGNWLGIKLLRK